MATDWLQTLQDQDAKSREFLRILKAMLEEPDVSIDEAASVYREVENAAQAFDRIVERMEDEDASEEVLDAADTMQDMWSQLSTLAVNKLRSLQGKEAIPYPL